MIISEDKLGTVCWTGQYQYVGGVPKYRDAFQNLGTLALSCSKSLWLFYLFCQLFQKPIKRDTFLFKENFLLKIRSLMYRHSTCGFIKSGYPLHISYMYIMFLSPAPICSMDLFELFSMWHGTKMVPKMVPEPLVVHLMVCGTIIKVISNLN